MGLFSPDTDRMKNLIGLNVYNQPRNEKAFSEQHFERMNRPLPDKVDPKTGERTKRTETPDERWKRSVESLMTSGHPGLYKTGLSMISQYHQSRNKSDSGISATTLMKEMNASIADGSWDPETDGGLKEYSKWHANRKKLAGADGSGKGRWGVAYKTWLKDKGLEDTAENWITYSGDSRASGAQQAAALEQIYKLYDGNPPQEALERHASAWGLNKYLDRGDSFTSTEREGIGLKDQTVTKNLAIAEYEKAYGKDIAPWVKMAPEEMRKDDTNLMFLNDTKRLLKKLGDKTSWASVGFASWLDKIPVLPPNEARVIIEGLKSRFAIDQINKMKRETSTGATGFGALNETELMMLVGYIGTLDSSVSPEEMTDQIKHVMLRIENMMDQAKERQGDNYFKYKEIHSDGDGPFRTSQRVIDRWDKRFTVHGTNTDDNTGIVYDADGKTVTLPNGEKMTLE